MMMMMKMSSNSFSETKIDYDTVMPLNEVGVESQRAVTTTIQNGKSFV
jgi:hypothetical protein